MARAWNEKDTFLEAIALPAEQRDAYLQRVCPDQAALDRLRGLLLQHTLSELVPNPGAQGEPTQIDEFRIRKRLGGGGMGVVYLAEDTTLGRLVAIKILAPHLSGSEQALARFRTEARITAGLNHPAIVPVHRFGFDGQHHYLVSEFVDGPTLGALIDQERRRRSAEAGKAPNLKELHQWHLRVAEIMATIAEALDASHRVGVVHRDVKPSNILITPAGNPRLTDFGIATAGNVETLTQSSEFLGSCYYMSPEQAAIVATPLDGRSDVFSLGVVAYEMLALKLPFEGSALPQVLAALAQADPTRLRSIDRTIPKDLETICHRALQKSPFARYQLAAHMAADLRCYLQGLPILARPHGPLRRLARLLGRYRRTVSIASVIGFALLSAGIIFFMYQHDRDASMAWVSVESPGQTCLVYLQSHDPHTFLPVDAARRIGTTPLRHWKLPPGQFRMTLVRLPDHAFCEFNLLLLNAGASSEKHVRAIDASSASGSSYDPSVEVAVFHDTSEVVARMIHIPAGVYQVGDCQELHVQAAPQVGDFYIDLHQVSNREYREFTDATGHAKPYLWSQVPSMETIADLPVTYVSVEDAEAYARWGGKRLATSLEWQAAARGTRGDLFPSGATLVPEIAQPSHSQAASSNLVSEYLVGVLPVTSPAPWDTLTRPINMFSNVRELTATVEVPTRHVLVAGRSWSEAPRSTTLAQMFKIPLLLPPSPRIGFRCAKSVVPPKETVP